MFYEETLFRSKESRETLQNSYSSDGCSDCFRILSVLDSNTKTPLRSFFDEAEAQLGIRGSDSETKAFVLSSGHSAKVRLRFRPTAANDFQSALFVRNNLTGVEVAEIRAQSVFGSLSFGSWKTNGAQNGDKSVLRFEVSEKLLKDCNRKKEMMTNLFFATDV